MVSDRVYSTPVMKQTTGCVERAALQGKQPGHPRVALCDLLGGRSRESVAGTMNVSGTLESGSSCCTWMGFAADLTEIGLTFPNFGPQVWFV